MAYFISKCRLFFYPCFSQMIKTYDKANGIIGEGGLGIMEAIS